MSKAEDYKLYVHTVVGHFGREKSKFPSYWELNRFVCEHNAGPIVETLGLVMLQSFEDNKTTWQCAKEIEECISIARAQAWDFVVSKSGAPQRYH